MFSKGNRMKKDRKYFPDYELYLIVIVEVESKFKILDNFPIIVFNNIILKI